MKLRGMSRREFLQSSAVYGSTAALGAVPARGSILGANDRIHLGLIGAGTMGSNHVKRLTGCYQQDNIRLAAVSDVYQKRLSRAADACQGDGYLDYRALLDRNDIDAVVVATPEHWHAKMSIDAMEAGKHVYVEKPMTRTTEQALQLRNAVRRLGKVLQVGTQHTAKDAVWKAREAIQAGRIGKVTWAQGSWSHNFREDKFNAAPFSIEPSASPQATGENYIDWDMWLGWKFGLAPQIPFDPDHFFRFRKYWAYSGGLATDLLYHKLAPLLVAIAGPNGEYPSRVNACGGLYVAKDGRDLPDTFLMTLDYPSEYSIFLVTTSTNDTQLPDRIYGNHGTLDFTGTHRTERRDVVLQANGEFAKEFRKRNDGYGQVRLAGEERRDMMGNFIDVIRGQGRLYANAELGTATMVAIKLGVEAYRHSKTMLWDTAKEKEIA